MPKKEILQTLQDGEAMRRMVAMAVNHMSSGRDTGSPSFDDLLTAIFQANCDHIDKYCESPIEKQLFNSLQMAAITQGTFVFVRPPAHDFRCATKDEYGELVGLFQCKDFYDSLPDSARPDSFGGFLSAFPELSESNISTMESKVRLDFDLGFCHYPNLVLQQSLQGIFSEGAVRPDGILYVPSNPKVLIVIECDGHEFHGSKESFIADRQRDRRFLDKGFTVRRYSGSEIYKNPAEASMDLLRSIEEGESGPHWKDKWEASVRAANSNPSPDVIKSWEIRKHDSQRGSI